MLKLLSDQERLYIATEERQYRKENFEEPPMWDDPFLHDAFAGIPPDDEVIDVGCGLGRAIPMFGKLGIRRYLGVDPSRVSTEYCQKKWPNLAFEVGDIRELGMKYPARFGGFLLLAVLLHLPRRDLDKVFTSLRGCLKQGAPGLIITMLGQQGRLMVRGSHGMKYTLLTYEEIVEALQRNGFVPGRFAMNHMPGIPDPELRMHVVAR